MIAAPRAGGRRRATIAGRRVVELRKAGREMVVRKVMSRRRTEAQRRAEHEEEKPTQERAPEDPHRNNTNSRVEEASPGEEVVRFVGLPTIGRTDTLTTELLGMLRSHSRLPNNNGDNSSRPLW